MTSQKNAARAILIIFWCFLVVCVLSVSSHCATTSSKNSLGVVTYTSNPLMYVAGKILDAKSVEGNLNLRVSPLGTYSLYDESILFCGMPIDKFEGVTEPAVLTYERVAHRAVNGVGCHRLVRADSMAVTKELK